MQFLEEFRYSLMLELLEKLIELQTIHSSSWGFIAKSGKIFTPDPAKYGAHEDYALEWLSDRYGSKRKINLHQFYDETGYIRFSTISSGGYNEVAVWIWGNMSALQFRTIAKMAKEYSNFSFDIYRRGRLLTGGSNFLDFRRAIEKLSLIEGEE